MPTPKLKTEEDQFLKDYLNWLKRAGYDLNFHVIDAKRHAKVTSRGYPDVTSSHPQRGLLIAELKSPRGRPSKEQWAWLTRVAKQLPPPPDDNAKGRVHLWKPADRLKALTQMGIPEGPPVDCDCPICRFLDGQPTRQRRRTARPAEAGQHRCPICSRPMTVEQLINRGTCGYCPPSSAEEYEAALIAERIIERVF